MKRLFLLLTMSLIAISYGFAQTKTKQVEKDGFVWYKIKDASALKEGAMDENGKIIIPAEYLMVNYYTPDHEFTINRFTESNKIVCGIYRKDGSPIIPESRDYKFIYKHYDKDYGYYYDVHYELNEGVGHCDEDGREIISPKRGYTRIFPKKKHGIEYFCVEKEGKEGICNKYGDEIIAPQYRSIIYIDQFEYKDSNGKWIETGVHITDMAFSSPQNSNSSKSAQTGDALAETTKTVTKGSNVKSNNFAQAKIKQVEEDGFVWYKIEKDNLKGALDTKGKVIVPANYTYLVYEKNSFIVQDNEEHYGVYGRTGNIIIPTSRGYTWIYSSGDKVYGDYYWVNKNGYGGICDIDGNEILSPNLGFSTVIIESEYGIPYIVAIKKNNEGSKVGIYNVKGENVIPAIYDTRDYEYNQFYMSGKPTGISLNDSRFTSAFTNIDLTRQEAQKLKETKKTEKDGFVWYKLEQDFKCGARNVDGKMIIPKEYYKLFYSDANHEFVAIANNNATEGRFRSDGTCIIPLSRGYDAIYKQHNDIIGDYYIVKKNGSQGICDADGHEVLVPERGYNDVHISNSEGKAYIVAKRGDMVGICDIYGNEIISPEYNAIIYYDNFFEVRRTLNGNFSNTNITLNDDFTASKITQTYSSNVTKKRNNNFWRILGAGLLATAAVMQANAGYTGGYSSPQRTPMPRYNGNGSAYVAQIRTRTNQQMADLNNRVQQIKHDGITQFQNYSNRSLNATMELADWCAQFKNQNGREPYESEKDQWMQQHYPDVYPYYIQGKYGGGNSDSNAETENSGQKAKSTQSNSTRDCVYCNGSGRVVIEKSSLSFGIGEKRKKCQECGAWIMSDEAHVHVDCNHCKGTGKVTY